MPERGAVRGVGAGYGLGAPFRGGQMTPSQPGPPLVFGLFLHLKSGAFGLRFERRSSHIGPPQMGQVGIPANAAGCSAPAATGVTAAIASRGGQITPSHSRFLHLKSGALGLRLPTRLSHISPWHFGHVGSGDASSEGGVCCSVIDCDVNGGGGRWRRFNLAPAHFHRYGREAIRAAAGPRAART
jgi:hypothetical protein